MLQQERCVVPAASPNPQVALPLPVLLWVSTPCCIGCITLVSCWWRSRRCAALVGPPGTLYGSGPHVQQWSGVIQAVLQLQVLRPEASALASNSSSSSANTSSRKPRQGARLAGCNQLGCLSEVPPTCLRIDLLCTQFGFLKGLLRLTVCPQLGVSSDLSHDS
jgi:hypothetical protein